MNSIQIQSIIVKNFNPKTTTAEIKISFSKNNIQQSIEKEVLLKSPLNLIREILIEIKSKNKIIIEDPRLNPVEMLEKYSPVRIIDEDQTEEKIYNFLKNLCDKAIQLKKKKEAREYMQLLDQFKTSQLTLQPKEF